MSKPLQQQCYEQLHGCCKHEKEITWGQTLALAFKLEITLKGPLSPGTQPLGLHHSACLSGFSQQSRPLLNLTL